MLTLFELSALLLVLTAAFAWFNRAVLRLPHAGGLLLLGLCASLAIVALERLAPAQTAIYGDLRLVLDQVDFRETVLNGLLAFLLFAGALTVDLSLLRERAWIVGIMASCGVILSTVIVGVGFFYMSRLLHVPVPLTWALVFGALISPTDPVAVLDALRAARAPASLELDMAGEALFNDGVGVVLFTALLTVATGRVGEEINAVNVIRLFASEALGGAALGLVAGYLAYRAIRTIDDYAVETLVTLALVTGTYALATRLGLSGPIAMVVAGILVGNHGPRDAMSAASQRYVFGFWRLIDEMLNMVLFMLIGLEVLVLGLDPIFAGLALAAIPLTLLARFISVGALVQLLDFRHTFVSGSIAALTWGGLRGGISIALALALPNFAGRPAVIASTYAVVVFTIVVQGFTFRYVVPAAPAPERVAPT